MVKSKIMPSIEDMKHLQIPLQEVSSATNGFADQNRIAKGGFGNIYKGISEKHGHIAVKRLDPRQGQGDHEFKTEISLLSKCEHENIVSLLGFCDEKGEKILVYKFESYGSLDRHLENMDLTWIQRLQICLDVARGLKYVHDNVGSQLGVFHRDVKSANILLGENWKAKISDFGLSRIRPANMQTSFLITNPCGTIGYMDPNYRNNGYLTQKSDVYSFGVVLWEVLCGRLAWIASYNDERQYLTDLAERHYKRESLDMIIPSYLHKQMNTDSLKTFSKIAYQCLKNREERPTMKEVVEQLQQALHNQLEVKKAKRKRANKEETREKKKEEGSLSFQVTHPQEFVFLVFMHCKDCARKVKKCLKDIAGVERVVTDCDTHKVTVMGEKIDPLKVKERIKKETNREVELVIPVPKPLAEEAKKLEQEKTSKWDDKKNEGKMPEEGKKAEKEVKPDVRDEKKGEGAKDPPPPPAPEEFIFKVFMHCEECARRIKKCLKGFEGVEGVETDCETSKVVVKGQKANPLKVLERIHKETKRKVEILPPISKVLAKEPNRKEEQCLKGFEGVGGVRMDFETQKVLVREQ